MTNSIMHDDYLLERDNKSFLIEVAYLGVFGDKEIPKPFVLSYTVKIRADDKTQDENFLEFYETYEAVASRRTELNRLQ